MQVGWLSCNPVGFIRDMVIMRTMFAVNRLFRAAGEALCYGVDLVLKKRVT